MESMGGWNLSAHTGFCDKCGGGWLRGLTVLALATGAMLWAKNSHALFDGRLEPFVAHAVIHDDNVFRLSERLDPASVLGSSSKSDTYRTTSAGLNLDVPVGRQRIQGGLSFNQNRFDRFSVLDFNERHGRALWQWVAGDDFSGRLGYTTDRALASLANIQGGVQLSTPNPLETKKALLDAVYLLTPRWRLRGEVSRLEQSNGAPALQVNDIRNDSIGVTFSHVSPAKNQIGLGIQSQDGSLENRQIVNGSPIDNSYRQYRVILVTDWTISGRSHLSASAGQVDRSFTQLPERDFSTGIFHVAYQWKPTGKFTLVALAKRDISAPDEINAGVNIGFVLAKGFALRPAFQLTEKINVSGVLDHSDWRYLGDPGMALGTVPPRSDRVRTAALEIAYEPIRALRLEMGLRRETRSSTAAFGDYKAEAVSIRARLAF